METGSNQGAMTKKIKSCDEEDGISSLPDTLIHHILSFLLSTEEAVKTGILSKRWRDQWTYVQNLNFNYPYCFSDEKLKCFSKFIHNTLVLNSCSKINKFSISPRLSSDKYMSEYQSQISLCMRFAIKKEAKVLTLDFHPSNQGYRLPQFFYSNDSVTEMTLSSCGFSLNADVNWRSLKVLCIQFAYLTNRVIKDILSGSPQLESFELHNCQGIGQLDIASKCLKRLVLDGIKWAPLDVLEISGPYLEKLEFSHTWEFRGGILMNLPSLSCATLDCQRLNRMNHIRADDDYDDSDDDDDDEEEEEEVEEDEDEHEEEEEGYKIFVEGVLQQVQHVEELKVGAWFIQRLSIMEVNGQTSPLSNSKCLTVIVPCFITALPGIAILLSSSPGLEKLRIMLESGKSGQDFRNSVSW
ncbi:F-box/LRR-repeat protein 25 isoform X2 [Ricinus communis]|uniref:F-box/LRR-repeat protein 25 isoform X2 n=1 Tax=Ricinus communis TaxID=3988 RepID=UPI00201AF01D|nr:F-box/LRR-repeat protein 25 isoform X2 [Ricinus communis]